MLEKLGVGVGGVVVDLKQVIRVSHFEALTKKAGSFTCAECVELVLIWLTDSGHTQNLHRAWPARLCKNGSLRGKRLCLFLGSFSFFIRMDKVYVARGVLRTHPSMNIFMFGKRRTIMTLHTAIAMVAGEDESCTGDS